MKSDFDILVTLSTFAEYSRKPLKELEQSPFTFQLNPSGKRMQPEEVLRQGGNCIGLIAGVEPYTEETLNMMPNLRCISRVGVGIDSIDLDVCRTRDIAVLNTPDEPVLAVAELTLGMMLGLMRQLPRVNALTCARKWQRVPGNLLSGKTVGLIGLGRIGRKVAQMVNHFQTEVIAYDPVAQKEWAQKNGVSMVTFETLLQRADIVSIHASGGNNKLVIGKDELARMKKGAWLINVARGEMVDDIALSQALDSGQISGAGLDVFPLEPYTGPLCDNERVILTPHQATLNYETRVDMEVHAVRNIVEYLGQKR